MSWPRRLPVRNVEQFAVFYCDAVVAWRASGQCIKAIGLIEDHEETGSRVVQPS